MGGDSPSFYVFRFLEDNYNLMNMDPLTFLARTDCSKPCRYNRYHIVGELHTSTFNSSEFVFSLLASTNDTLVETETLMFPWTSLVAEFGGTLSLFLGVSFMTVWDVFVLSGRFLKHFLQAFLNRGFEPECLGCSHIYI